MRFGIHYRLAATVRRLADVSRHHAAKLLNCYVLAAELRKHIRSAAASEAMMARTAVTDAELMLRQFLAQRRRLQRAYAYAS